MENCYEKGEIEICDGRLVRIWKHRPEWPGGGFPVHGQYSSYNSQFFPIQESCGLEERRWEGILVGVELGCKSSIQCHSDISTNFIAATNQCRPTDSGKLFRTKWRCLL